VVLAAQPPILPVTVYVTVFPTPGVAVTIDPGPGGMDNEPVGDQLYVFAPVAVSVIDGLVVHTVAEVGVTAVAGAVAIVATIFLLTPQEVVASVPVTVYVVVEPAAPVGADVTVDPVSGEVAAPVEVHE